MEMMENMENLSRSPYRRTRVVKHWGTRLFLSFLIFCLMVNCAVQLLLTGLFSRKYDDSKEIGGTEIVLPAMDSEIISFPQYGIKAIREEGSDMGKVEYRLDETDN